MKRIAFLLIVFSGIAAGAAAQGRKLITDAETARDPLWIPMLDDTTANFYVVEGAFSNYFSHHQLPKEADEEVSGRVSRRKQRRIDEEIEMRLAVRRYYKWRSEVLPHMEPDGHIPGPAERALRKRGR